MIKKATNTTFTLGIISVINFLLVILISNILGKEGVSEMGFIVLGISFIVMLNNLIGGASLVYLVPRKPVSSLFLISYSWSFVSVFIMGTILYVFELVPMDYFVYVVIIGVLESFFSINNQILLGKQKIGNHNFLKIFQKIIQIIVFILLGITIQNFVIAIVVSQILTLIISAFLIRPFIKFSEANDFKNIFLISFKYGFEIQSSNIVQLLNYRFLYYIIDKNMGSVLGIYIVAIQLAESLWIPSKALAVIQYSELSNEEKESKRKEISLRFLKISFFVTSILFGILVLIPNSVFLFFFGKDITGVTPIILSLGIGIISIALNQIFAHYLSGKGIYKYNIRASAIGFLIILLLGNLFVFEYGLIGAGLVTSISYFASMLYLGFVFFNKSKTSLNEIFISKSDIVFCIKFLLRK